MLKPARYNVAIILSFLLAACGCMSLDAYVQNRLEFTSYQEVSYPPYPNDREVELFFAGKKPQRDYDVIGELNGSLDKAFRPLLETRARQLGADALIDITVASEDVNVPKEIKVQPGIYQGQMPVVTEPGFSYRVYAIKAKAIRYK